MLCVEGWIRGQETQEEGLPRVCTYKDLVEDGVGRGKQHQDSHLV